ncbi:hypothetical protein JHK85_013621 [Glycine max]|nr:hypothetical protein JHK85_013621 [Glycine max]
MAIKGSGDNFSTCSLWFKESSKCSLGESKEGEGGPTKAYLMNDYESEGKLQNSALCVTTGFEDAGDFTVSERLKTGLHQDSQTLLGQMTAPMVYPDLLWSIILHRNPGCTYSLIARYAPPISFNFFNLIRLGSDKTTIFEQQMGNIDNAVPFFGDKFNRIYPLIMVIYTLLVASNFFDRVFDSLGSWKRYVFETEAEDMGGFDPSGLIILQKADMVQVKNGVEMKGNSSLVNKEIDGNLPKTLKEETRRYSSSREAISSRPEEKNLTSSRVSLPDHSNTHSSNASGTSGLASTWQTMKTGFQSFGANLGGKEFLPIRQTQEAKMSRVSSSESLDDIFQRLKRPALDQNIHNENDYLRGGNISGPSR